jgi:hypothetical protein
MRVSQIAVVLSCKGKVERSFMQIKHFLFGGAMAVSLFACAPASRYEADGAFSSEPAFSQAVRPSGAVTTKPAPGNTTTTTTTTSGSTTGSTGLTNSPGSTTGSAGTTGSTTTDTPATTATPPATPTAPDTNEEVIIGEAAPANAGGGPGVNVLPESYTTTPGNGSYIDDTGRQLIDNQVGGDRFNVKIFGTPGFEWLGWSRKSPVMTFKFTNERKFTKVKIGFNYNSGAGILLPLKVTINGKAYDLKGTELKRNSRGFLVFNVNFTSNQITIDLERNPARQWILVDEVKFVAVQQVTL